MRVAGLLVALQGATGLVLMVVIIGRAVAGTAGVVAPLATAVWFAVFGAAVLGVGLSLLRGRHGARTPAVVAQLLLLGVAWYAAGPSGRLGYGIAAGLYCATALVLLFVPATVRWASAGRDDTDGTGDTDDSGDKAGGVNGSPRAG